MLVSDRNAHNMSTIPSKGFIRASLAIVADAPARAVIFGRRLNDGPDGEN
jgi:hypothetical protein